MNKLLIIMLPLFSSIGYAQSVKVVRLCAKTVVKAYVSPKGTIINFPIKPSKIILGKKKSFGIEYVENDLAISPYASNSNSNLFVYLHGRRFVFNLVTSPSYGRTIYMARDCKAELTKVRRK